jgi:hypothetical protein
LTQALAIWKQVAGHAGSTWHTASVQLVLSCSVHFGFGHKRSCQVCVRPRCGRHIVDRMRSLIRPEPRSPERMIEASKMTSAQRRVKTLVEMIGCALIAVLVGALACTGTVFAQCGPTRPESAGNTACGDGALASNTGFDDSAFGLDALVNNTTGVANTASGVDALVNNTTGAANTASGWEALYSNTTGAENTASGDGALVGNTTGNANTASGDSALTFNSTGAENTASGRDALYNNTTGNGNIGLGAGAGYNIRTGSNNIEIASPGAATDKGTIRIGTNGTHKITFIAGISTSTVAGSTVEVTSSGRLGITPSAARYKRDIRAMGAASAGLMRLRPVTFRYKDDPSETLQYGLVAEEVARVYPELVTRGTDGKLESVRYLEFTALLLNELQKQTRENKELGRANRELRSEVAQVRAEQARERAAFDERLSAVEQSVQASKPEARLSAMALRTGLRSLDGRP